MPAPLVFVSYSHKDGVWKDRLGPQLRTLERLGTVVVWDDRSIDVGEQWYDEIRNAMDRAVVAICLISSDYLASSFCTKEEVPHLLERRARDGMVIIPVLLRPCLWEAIDWLSPSQMLPRDGKSVAEDFVGREDGVFREIARAVLERVHGNVAAEPSPRAPTWPILPESRISIERLPVTGQEAFGRHEELKALDQAWDTESVGVVSLVAWGGVGKSTLVNRWLARLAADHYRGATRVFAWSFYSQGTDERVSSAEAFLTQALRWFGDPYPSAGSPWERGERLAARCRAERVLLVLDGLEPLQSRLDHERGDIKDPGLATLLRLLAVENPGLCVVTTREPITALVHLPGAHRIDLEQISAEAGRALLRVAGVRGTDAELEHATRSFGHHALALILLSRYLLTTPRAHIGGAFEVGSPGTELEFAL